MIMAGKSKTLLIDAGNTRLKWCVLQAGNMGKSAAFVYDWPSLLEQLGSQFAALAGDSLLRQVLLCNVAGSRVIDAVKNWAAAQGVAVKEITAMAEAYGVRNAYGQPQLLGADRWAGLVAARRLMTGSACMIDCGSALTVDVMTQDGLHKGGIILPGLALMAQSLATNTDALPELSVNRTPAYLGQDTASAIHAGIVAAAVGAIMRTVNAFQTNTPGALPCIITGGDAEKLLPLLPEEFHYEPDWVLKGLVVMAEDLA